ncbi:hypothetical protein [Kitasatospora sp. NPDC017646]|uniref:hypothetical protein n=1 Tax=Kitasatospora sp. NPDC017646 TaxID=3364024 RepID=UPI0037BA3083
MTELSDWNYVVTDIEVDGPWPGANSMRSFASVATTMDGRTFGEFEAPELPARWLGEVEHTHKAIDDARGFANLLHFLARNAGAPAITSEA